MPVTSCILDDHDHDHDHGRQTTRVLRSPFSVLRSERRNVPSHWVCTTSANGVQGQGAGKATTPEDKTSSSEEEDKPGIASGSTARVERAASCERRSEKDDSEGVCEAATGAKIASTRGGQGERGRKFMEGQAVRVRRFMGRGMGNVGIGKPGAAFFLAPNAVG